MNKNTEIKLCDIGYVCADGEFIPSIFSSDKKNVKNIMTGEIAPASLLSAETKDKFTGDISNDFAQKLYDAEDVKVYAFSVLDLGQTLSILPLFNYANTWDRLSNKIIKYVVYDRKFWLNEGHSFPIKCYEQLSKFLEKAYAKDQKEKELEAQIKRDQNKKVEDYKNMFRF